jgi:hypothetical protein
VVEVGGKGERRVSFRIRPMTCSLRDAPSLNAHTRGTIFRALREGTSFQKSAMTSDRANADGDFKQRPPVSDLHNDAALAAFSRRMSRDTDQKIYASC